MKNTSIKYRFLLWFAKKVCAVQYTVKFDKPGSDEFYAVAFAATPGAANRVRGNDMLVEKLRIAESQIAALSGTRSARRNMKRVAKAAMK